MHVKTSSGYIRTREGSEGPHYDPYHYTRMEYVRGSLRIEVHQGLGNWIKVNGNKLFTDDSQTIEHLFEMNSGFKLAHVEKWLRMLEERRYSNPEYAEMMAADAALLRYAM